MDYVYLTVLCSSIGTISVVLIYIYLFAMYRQRYMGIWATAWLILLSRYGIFDLGLLPWKTSQVGLIVYQLMIFISMLLFIWSTHVFIKKTLSNWWIYTTTFTFILTVIIDSIYFPLVYKLIIPIYFACAIGIWIGITFIRNSRLHLIGRLITGYSYILWSGLNLAGPIILSGSWILPWAHALGGIFRIFITIGTLMVYFENTREVLVERENQYRLLTENAVDVIYFYQILPDIKIQYINPAVFTFTGYSPEEYYINNKLIFGVIHPDDYHIFKRYISNFPNIIEDTLTLRLVRKDGAILWIEQKCNPIYDKNGNISGLQGIIRDITIRENLDKMTAMLDRMNIVGSMAATVAHEIRNPMTTVRGYLQFMKKKDKFQDYKDDFSLMIEELDRANNIIREYLSLSKNKVANFEKCSLNTIIEYLFPLIQADANASKISITMKLNDIPELQLDKNEIRQLILNLVRNGIEAMPKGGNLIIHTFQENDKSILSISDQGSGIPSNIFEKLGTPFITTKDTGTGLGIPMCYQIAKRHSAKIKIDTSSRGTTFSVCFNSTE